jgi:hypothetical protein
MTAVTGSDRIQPDRLGKTCMDSPVVGDGSQTTA